MKKTALIMAGGRGERFWPKSRKSLPKQFLSLTQDCKTMIQLTVERILPIVSMEDIYISTNADYLPLVREQLPELPDENIICEPVGRNTAPCIALGTAHIAKKHDDAVMMVLPSDHLIKQKVLFLNTLTEACALAQSGPNLVTIGITPDTPETEYGYISFDSSTAVGHAFGVEKFVEKPDLETARAYLASEHYLWNSGMFVWKVSTILDNMKTIMPDLYALLEPIRKTIGTPEETAVVSELFPQFQSISIDYGIMERASHIYTIPGSFGWDDVGSWLAVERINSSDDFGNTVSGNLVLIQTKNCIFQGDKKLIAAIGLQNLIVVDTPDALLICSKENASDTKKVLENLRICNKTEYL